MEHTTSLGGALYDWMEKTKQFCAKLYQSSPNSASATFKKVLDCF